MVGLMLVFAVFGTLVFAGVFERAGEVLHRGMATAIGLLLLVGAAGKSAQIPLYVWLPDAMEGPTPVSALIHAATMVTAGVYVIARSAADLRVHTGCRSGGRNRRGADRALGRHDRPGPDATSSGSWPTRRSPSSATCSWRSGPTAYVAGVFHLMTHAFFKALLFLGAGSVIHAMSDEQDMRKMGGLCGRCR